MKNDTDDTRPFGYWITAVDRLLRAEFTTVFEDEGVTRRDWRMLNRIDGTVPSGDGRALTAHRLRRLIELDWVRRTADGWELTEAGALAKQRLAVAVDECVAGALSAEEYATMTAALEKVARAFGWAEDRSLPRRGRRGHRHPNSRGQHRGHHSHGHRHGDHEDRYDRHARPDRDHHGSDREHVRGRRFGRHGFAHSHAGDCGHRDRFSRHGAPMAHHIHIHHHG